MTDADLRELAEKATPGPWEAIPEHGVANFHTSLYSEGYKGLLIACGDQNGAHTADMTFIAAFNPATAIALLDRLERAEKALERQTDNVAFILNHVALPDHWYDKFKSELEEDRAALTKDTSND